MRNLQAKDIFSLARVLKEAKIQEVIKNIYSNENISAMNAREVGFTVIFEVIGSLSEEKVEDKIYKFLSGPLEVTEKEVSEMDPCELVDKILEIATVEKWKDFLSKASQFLK